MSRVSPPDYTKPVMLMVEGELEAAYAEAMIRRQDWLAQFSVLPIKGLGPPSASEPTGDRVKLPRTVKAYLSQRTSTNRHLALWFDAETDRAARWQQVVAGLQDSGLPMPASEGTVATGTPVSTSILLMPSTGTGCFEMALLDACKLQGHLACAEQFLFLNCIPQAKSSQEWQAKVKTQGMWKAQLIGVGARKPDFPLEGTFSISRATHQVWDYDHAVLASLNAYMGSLSAL